MDANGQRFWMLADRSDFVLLEDGRFDTVRRTLRLASRRTLSVIEDAALAATLVSQVPEASDGYGSVVYWDVASPSALRARGPVSGVFTIVETPDAPTDLAVGHNGVLYTATQGNVSLRDLRDRWAPVVVSLAGFQAFRLAPTRDEVWVLDRAGRALAKLRGLPLPKKVGNSQPQVFRPTPENPHPPTLVRVAVDFGAADPVAIASSTGGRVAVLCWGNAGAHVRLLEMGETEAHLGPPIVLEGIARPYTMAWLDEARLAVRVTGLAEAVVFDLDSGTPAHAVGDFYPMRDGESGPFTHATAGPPLYPTSTKGAPRSLFRMSLPKLASAASIVASRVIDGGTPEFAWHRIYLEAHLPPSTGVALWLAASDEPTAPPAGEAWFPHTFGDVTEPDAPQGVWVPFPSEIPHHPGLLDCPRVPLRSGLFTALVQRRGLRVRTLRGRYLHVRLDLRGDGRSSPEVAAVRIYGERFSYVEKYLPELYREHVYPPDADVPSPRATPADFLGRMLANFEGILTLLEDRIANAHLLTDPAATPSDALDWLAGWVGIALDPAMPEDRRRRMIQKAPELAKSRGTLRGLLLALDVATGGAVERGEVVAVEDFRLRRTLATILGADLADEDDPLLAGIVSSGNSFVGETLILGNEERRELMSLFNADVIRTASDRAAVSAFFDRFAFRVTVLVQREQGRDLFAVTRKVAELEVPAHVDVQVVVASHPLVVGLTSLVSVDTYLRPRPLPTTARIDRSRIGERDVVASPPGLDPRLVGDPQ